MNKNLLLISADDFPSALTSYFQNQHFNCEFARGRLKIKEIFEKQKIDVAIWFFKGYETALADDLIAVFNRFKTVPVIMITQSFDDVETSKKVESLFDAFDANDEIEDIHKGIFRACHENTSSSEGTMRGKEVFIPEINFKNVVREIVSDQTDEPQLQVVGKAGSQIEIETPWIAVDKNEKKIISAAYQPVKKQVLKKILRWLIGS